MSALIAVAIGFLSGAHTSTWGMYKDSPYEGFTWSKYFRSILVSAVVAVTWELFLGFDLRLAWTRVVLFGLTYASERGIVELYKGYLREEDQSKYFIPMQFHVMGHVIQSRAVRWAVAAVLALGVLLVGCGLRALEESQRGVPGWAAILIVGSIGGWLSAFGGAFKDAPIEGFETMKFFRSPAIALLWSLLVACFSRDYVQIALCGLGYTVATIETYKTFFFPSKPRGKFAGKPILFPRFLTWRYRFAPFYAAIWVVIVLNIASALSEPRHGLIGGSDSRSREASIPLGNSTPAISTTDVMRFRASR